MALTRSRHSSGGPKTAFFPGRELFYILLPYFYNILLPFSTKNRRSRLQPVTFSGMSSDHGKETDILQAESRGPEEAQVHRRRTREDLEGPLSGSGGGPDQKVRKEVQEVSLHRARSLCRPGNEKGLTVMSPFVFLVELDGIEPTAS